MKRKFVDTHSRSCSFLRRLRPLATVGRTRKQANKEINAARQTFMVDTLKQRSYKLINLTHAAHLQINYNHLNLTTPFAAEHRSLVLQAKISVTCLRNFDVMQAAHSGTATIIIIFGDIVPKISIKSVLTVGLSASFNLREKQH